MSRDADKAIAAAAAVEEVSAGMIVGLGSGTTVAHLIPLLAARKLDIAAVPTSNATAVAARDAGLRLIPFEDRAAIDLTIDGVDEIDGGFRAIKGGGGAMLREKIVASAARRMVAIADGSKMTTAIGARPVPVEILPFACAFVLASLGGIGARPTLRTAGGRPVQTDQGNVIVDCAFAALPDPGTVAAMLSAIPGVLGHGLFLDEIDALYIADAGVVRRHERG